MNGWEQVITQFGVSGLMAFFLWLILRHYINQSADMNTERRELETERVEEIKAFITATNNFTMVVENHIDHNLKAVERLCDCVDKNTMVMNELVRELRITNGRKHE